MSKSNSTAAASGGTSTLSLLLVLFIGLKLTGHINWSWWWVLSPFWIPVSLVLIALGIVLIIRSRVI